MSERIPIGLVGCGGMGRRHLTGLAALYRSDFQNVELVAVCDLNRQNAEDLADEAAKQLGRRPEVFGDVRGMAQARPEVQGVDVVTDVAGHPTVAVACLEAGLHVQCEKPLAITVRGCNRIIEAARRGGKILSVAENYRRDPINRLIRALIHDGAIGTPQLMIDTGIGGGDRITITPWRHRKLSGTIALDAGVHNADILQYYLGEIATVFGEGRIFQPLRRKGPPGGPGGFYAKWYDTTPEVIEATGEDSVFGYLRFQNGAIGQWIYHGGSFGQPQRGLYVYGSKGSLTSPGHRNGKPIRLHLADQRVVEGEEILDLAPSYRLSPIAAQLFGGERPWTYEFPFADTDAKIMALEYHEFGACMQSGQSPEVTGEVARDAVALVNAIFESGVAGRAVTLDEVIDGTVDGYQREIDAHFHLIATD